MFEAALWGIVAASSLVVGAVLALVAHPGHRIVGLTMAFGAGMLITSVSYELVGDAVAEGDAGTIAIAMLLGALVFVAGDIGIDRLGGKRPGIDTPSEELGSGPAIVLGTVLDGIPESFVLGLTVLTQGSVNMAFLAAVFVSNIPEALSASTSLHDGGWTGGRILGMWTLIAAVSGVAAMCGYVFLDGRSPVVGMRIQAFAAGAILAMLADAMMPDGFAFGGKFAGLATVLGFVTGIGLTSLE